MTSSWCLALPILAMSLAWPVVVSAQPADPEATFAERCAVCHGADGRGAERGPDIVTLARTANRPVADLERIIVQGIPAGGMPPTTIDGDAAAALARHVRALAEASREPRTYPQFRATLRDGAVVDGLALTESTFELQDTSGPGDWPTYNGALGGNRHTDLDGIRPENVTRLGLAWTSSVGTARNPSGVTS